MITTPNLLLLSSSRIPTDTARLHYAQPFITGFLRNMTEEVTFIPYASVAPLDDSVGAVRGVFASMNLRLQSVHETKDPLEAIHRAKSLCVGGGNTHLLNRALHERGLRDAIREKVLDEGIPYVGWSAGSNVAFGGIETTNDMNVIGNIHFQGLGLIEGGLRLSPHFADSIILGDLPEPARRAAEELMRAAPGSALALKHQGETREQRLLEYLSAGGRGPVIGLYEGGILELRGESLSLTGVAGAMVFKKGKEPSRHEPGSDLSPLLEESLNPPSC